MWQHSNSMSSNLVRILWMFLNSFNRSCICLAFFLDTAVNLNFRGSSLIVLHPEAVLLSTSEWYILTWNFNLNIFHFIEIKKKQNKKWTACQIWLPWINMLKLNHSKKGKITQKLDQWKHLEFRNTCSKSAQSLIFCYFLN